MDTVQRALVGLGFSHPRLVIGFTILATVVFAALMFRIEVDTNPENMLPSDDPVRVLNQTIHEDFGVREIVALAIVSQDDILTAAELTSAAALLEAIEGVDGVVPGTVSFRLVADLPSGPLTDSDVQAVKDGLAENPALASRLISDDGMGLTAFIPIEKKSVAAGGASDIRELTEEHRAFGSTEYFIAGLPLAEDAFGSDMFIQMGLLAPLAGLLIFVLLVVLFRRLLLVLVAMAVAMVTVIWTMGLLIGTGFTVHIMSSMIPIFLMPIAILDSVHVMSELSDRYRPERGKAATVRSIYSELFAPLTFTTITTIVAFASLAIAPIPPVRVFGIFVAVGVFIAWLLTMLLIPASAALIRGDRLEQAGSGIFAWPTNVLSAGVERIGRFATRGALPICVALVLIVVAIAPGLSFINVNDNPVRWFRSGSEIRQATNLFAEEFGGAFNASLIIAADEPGALLEDDATAAVAALQSFWAGLDGVGSSLSFIDIDSGASDGTAALVPSLINPNGDRANLQLLLRDGDNQAMQSIVDQTDDYLAANPLPAGVSAEWGGESYLNLVWQDKMVKGMLAAFASTFAVVLVLMVLLFRSIRLALLAMIPMSVTVLAVYGIIGYWGRDYDMPLAVLSTLVLGIGIDFAIHFIQRFRVLKVELGSSSDAFIEMFGEPGRAITRNALVIGVGFMPLLFSSLIPYIIVGLLLMTIMAVSWAGTMFGLPAIVTLAERFTKRASSPLSLYGGALPHVLATSLLVACERDPYRVGIERNSDGGITVQYAPCEGNPRVSRVALAQNERYSPVWEIGSRNSAGEVLYQFAVGEVAHGFVESVPLRAPLTADSYFAIVDSSFLFEHSYSFALSDVRKGLILAGEGKYTTIAEFNAGALCD